MDIQIKIAREDEQKGELRFKRVEDNYYPAIRVAEPLYEEIKTQWVENTDLGVHSDGTKDFVSIVDTVILLRVTDAPSRKLGRFVSACKHIAETYYYEMHRPKMHLKELEGEIETREE